MCLFTFTDWGYPSSFPKVGTPILPDGRTPNFLEEVPLTPPHPGQVPGQDEGLSWGTPIQVMSQVRIGIPPVQVRSQVRIGGTLGYLLPKQDWIRVPPLGLDGGNPPPPPPPLGLDGGTPWEAEQQSEHLLRGGWYASWFT